MKFNFSSFKDGLRSLTNSLANSRTGQNTNVMFSTSIPMDELNSIYKLGIGRKIVNIKSSNIFKEGFSAEDEKGQETIKFIDKKLLPLESGIPFSLYINDVKIQESNSNNMIFNFNKIIAHISKYITLRLGDIIFTGTPSGVGKVNIGDKLEGFINEEKIMKFNIK